MPETPPTDDPAMTRVRELWAAKKAIRMTQEELGVAMGYELKSAKKSANQFFRTKDPRISMLRRFAKAMGVPLSELVRD
jgi:transcriptional regulator with XRE-family HTH domain